MGKRIPISRILIVSHQIRNDGVVNQLLMVLLCSPLAGVFSVSNFARFLSVFICVWFSPSLLGVCVIYYVLAC